MAKLYGPDGRPIESAPRRELTRRVAVPSVVGLRQPHAWVGVAEDLTPARLQTILRAVRAGNWCPDYHELAEEIEERWLHCRGVLQQRRLAAAAAPFDVQPASDRARDVALADEVRTHLLQGPRFHDLVLTLLDGLMHGVAAVEVVWARPGMAGPSRAPRWRPAAYHRVDPRWLVWSRDGETPFCCGATPGGRRR